MRFMIFLDWMHSAMGKVIWNIFYSCNKHKAGWITAKRGSWYEITLSYKLEFGRKFSFVTMLLKRCDKKRIVCSAYPSLTRHKCQLQWEFPLGRHQGDWECNGQRWLPGSANQWDCSNPWREQSITRLSQSFSLSYSLLARSQHRSTCRTWGWPCSGTGPSRQLWERIFRTKYPPVVALQFSVCFAFYIVRRFLL